MTNRQPELVGVEMEKVFADLYYNVSDPVGYGSVDKLKNKTQASKKETLQWLSGQDAYTLHKKKLQKFSRRKTMVRGMNIQWQLDLVDMIKYARYNSNYKYLLTSIDVFSRYAHAVPLKKKTGSEVVRALKKILTSQQPLRLQVDRGAEFYNVNVRTFLAKRNIALFSTYNETKAAMVERFNRTLKERMFRYFTKNRTYKYLDVLNDLVTGYNNSMHRITRMKPVDVNKENESDLWKRLYSSTLRARNKFKFKIGDAVRLGRLKNKFEKGYTPNWTTEHFHIFGRRGTNPVTYKLKDEDGEVIKGSFYEPELQKIQLPNSESVYPVDIIRTKKFKNKQIKHYVHYRGWPDKFDEWVDAENMV